MLSGERRIEATDEVGVAEAVAEARGSGARLRPLGTGGSKSRITSVPERGLRLDQPDRILDVDGDLVTVPAGMTTGRLQELLRPHGLLLPTVGEWKNATIAGSLATATHGGSAHHGILSTSVRRLRLVTGTGRATEVTPEDPDFEHLGVSLGAFGVVTRVTVACVERFSLRLETDVVPFEDYLRDPATQESRSEYHASVWFPAAGRVARFAADPVREPGGAQPRRERFGRRTALAHFLACRLGLSGAVSTRFLGDTAVGDAARILSPLEVSSGVARFRNVANAVRGRKAAEFAVAASRAEEALTRFGELFRSRPGPLNNPIGLRMSAADGFSVSPCSGRDTLWMDVFYDDAEPFESELAEVAAEVDARCHWGKTMALPPGVLRRRYPAWEDFAAARDRYDPDEVFANAFTDALGLTGSPAGEGR